jgi:hypothetical protein
VLSPTVVDVSALAAVVPRAQVIALARRPRQPDPDLWGARLRGVPRAMSRSGRARRRGGASGGARAPTSRLPREGSRPRAPSVVTSHTSGVPTELVRPRTERLQDRLRGPRSAAGATQPSRPRGAIDLAPGAAGRRHESASLAAVGGRIPPAACGTSEMGRCQPVAPSDLLTQTAVWPALRRVTRPSCVAWRRQDRHAGRARAAQPAR